MREKDKTAKKKKFPLNFDFLQKLGKVLMTVIAVMAAGLMISIGNLIVIVGGVITFCIWNTGTSAFAVWPASYADDSNELYVLWRNLYHSYRSQCRNTGVWTRSTVAAVFLTGVTEPLEFITRIPMSLRAGLGGDIIHFILCVIVFFIVGYVVAYFMIGRFRYVAPGRLGNYMEEEDKEEKDTNGQGSEKAEKIIALLGGRSYGAFEKRQWNPGNLRTKSGCIKIRYQRYFIIL